MATPDMQRDQIEAGGKRPALARFAGIGWFNGVMLVIGAAAAIGFLTVISGAYLTATPNPGIILAGTIIIILMAIIWIVVGLFVIGGGVIGWFASRRKATPESHTRTEPQ